MDQLFLQLMSALFGQLWLFHSRIRRSLTFFINLVITLWILIVLLFVRKGILTYFRYGLHVSLRGNVPIRKNNISLTCWYLHSDPASRRPLAALLLFEFFMRLRKFYKSRTYLLIAFFLLSEHRCLGLPFNISKFYILICSFVFVYGVFFK